MLIKIIIISMLSINLPTMNIIGDIKSIKYEINTK
jgi:hypothetical protein